MKRYSVPVKCISPKGLTPVDDFALVFAMDVYEARFAAIDKLTEKYERNRGVVTEWIVTGDPVET